MIRVHGHTFVSDWVDARSVVVDFGMNHGAFSTRMRRLFDCEVYGAEAHPVLCEQLPRDPHIHPYNVAIGGGPGTLRLSIYKQHCASVVFSQLEAEKAETVDVPSVSFGGFMEQAGIDHVDLLKCDIEGAEVAMLEAASDDELRRIGQVTIEFHDFLDANQREPVATITRRLEHLGFWHIDLSKNRMDVLFINQHWHPLSWSSKTHIAGVKYLRGARRIVGRRIGMQDLGDDGFRLA
ncbi:FkbM family methyltransferase [Caldimonas brevitalea]|uniref:FkbM family methyltransferase n=1 Tax=Caldimonas brevitalea TaxID=413882 RepID=UPI001EEF2FF0|nr:FkbM family methyltransferase [Caldimonas brevitalea]